MFLKSFFINGQMNFRNYFDLQIWFLMIFIPAISMRIMSEEFKNGAIEYLLTKPISLLKIIF
jgi:ABC-2 type transport system permease protein